MSLGKLLATGRSLVGGAPDEGRYNLSPRHRLPRFGGGKNPFAPAPGAETPVKSPAPPLDSRRAAWNPNANAPAPVQPEPAPHFPGTASAARPAPAAPAPRAAAVRTPRFGVQARLLRGVMAVRGWGVRGWHWTRQRLARVGGAVRRPQAAFLSRFGRPVVQAELSLDDVKVVRSDLTESDLEFVEPTTSTVTTPGPKAPVASPQRGPVPPALKKLTDRILGPVAH